MDMFRDFDSCKFVGYTDDYGNEVLVYRNQVGYESTFILWPLTRENLQHEITGTMCRRERAFWTILALPGTRGTCSTCCGPMVTSWWTGATGSCSATRCTKDSGRVR